ncbi:MAG: response regulator [Anaerolineae bacterium]|nr:response regulator [Anaerolineae bacterium]
MSDPNAKKNAAAQQPDPASEQTDSQAASPGTTKPAAKSAAAKPKATKPKATKPAAAKPAAAKPKATKPKATKPAAAKPAAAKPEATKPAAAAPAVTPTAKIEFALVVDDEPANRDFLMRLLEQAALEVQGASTAQEARDIVKTADRLDVIVVDHKLPDGDGVDLMVELHAQYPAAYMIMATMLDERALMDKAFENGCDVFLVKPHGFMELFRRIKTAQATGDVDALKRMIIDQYGPRPYRG